MDLVIHSNYGGGMALSGGIVLDEE